MATYKNLFIDQGSSFEFTLDQSVDLANYSYGARYSKSYQSTTKSDFSVAANTDDDAIVISLAAEQTEAIKQGRYVYDIIIKNNFTGEITRVLEGQLHVNPGVTFDGNHLSNLNVEEVAEAASVTVLTLPQDNNAFSSRRAFAAVELNEGSGYYADPADNTTLTVSVTFNQVRGGNYGTPYIMLASGDDVNGNSSLLRLDGSGSKQELLNGTHSYTLMATGGSGQGGYYSDGFVANAANYLVFYWSEVSQSGIIEIELSNLEITASNLQSGNDQSFKEPYTLVNGEAFPWDTISSTTSLFKQS
jgi:hypothetical protein